VRTPARDIHSGGLLTRPALQRRHRVPSRCASSASTSARSTARPRRPTARASGLPSTIGAADGWYSLLLRSRPQRRTGSGRSSRYPPGSRGDARQLLAQLAAVVEQAPTSPQHHGRREGRRSVRSASTPSCEGLPTSPCILLKIDVDGGEMDVLEGGPRESLTNKPCRPLVVETHSQDLEDRCLAFVRDLGYARDGREERVVPRVMPEQRLSELQPLVRRARRRREAPLGTPLLGFSAKCPAHRVPGFPRPGPGASPPRSSWRGTSRWRTSVATRLVLTIPGSHRRHGRSFGHPHHARAR
jgi:hypothetical protein